MSQLTVHKRGTRDKVEENSESFLMTSSLKLLTSAKVNLLYTK